MVKYGSVTTNSLFEMSASVTVVTSEANVMVSFDPKFAPVFVQFDVLRIAPLFMEAMACRNVHVVNVAAGSSGVVTSMVAALADGAMAARARHSPTKTGRRAPTYRDARQMSALIFIPSAAPLPVRPGDCSRATAH